MGILNSQIGEICRALYVGRGSVESPSLSFEARPGTGIFLQGDNQIAFSVAGVEVLVIGDAGLQFDDGTAALPSITFDADLDTGIYRVGADRLGFTTAGVAAMEISATGRLINIAGTALLPSYTFVGDVDTGISAESANTLIFSVGGLQAVNITLNSVLVINEDSMDMDIRFEGNNNTNLLLLDAGLDALSFGAANVAGTFMAISPYAQSRAHVTSVGAGLHVPAGTLTDSGNASLAIGAANAILTPTWGGTGTYTDAATLYIAAAPAAGTKTQTRAYAVFVDAGQSRFDGGVVAGAGRLRDTMIITDLDAQNGTMLAAEILGGIYIHTSVTAGGTVTTDTAANIISGIPLQIDGEAITVHYINDGSQTVTFAGGTGVTFSDTGNTVLTNEGALILFRRTTSTTVSAHII